MDDTVDEPVDNYALFVGSLSANTTQEIVAEYFSRFGNVQGVNLITDWATGASKRCAIVFCSDERTMKSVLDCKVHKLDGKVIRVGLADQEKKGTKKISTTNLFVGNIAERCTENEIRLLFDKFGPIESVKFFKNASTKPNTKNAIIQYIDSKSVELAFKSKSEMGTNDDSLKISPLKQKKAPQTKAEAFDEIATMMLKLQRQETGGLNHSFGLNVKGFHFGQSNMGSHSELEDFPPPIVRRHRKSSSVDVLATKISSSDHYGDHYYSGFGNTPMPSFNMTKPSPGSFAFQAPDQIKYQMKLSRPEPQKFEIKVSKPEEKKPCVMKAAEDDAQMNNFITLIDLFDDDDNLSTSFYGVSPMRRSRQDMSTAKSSRRKNPGESGSVSLEENNSSKLSD